MVFMYKEFRRDVFRILIDLIWESPLTIRKLFSQLIIRKQVFIDNDFYIF